MGVFSVQLLISRSFPAQFWELQTRHSLSRHFLSSHLPCPSLQSGVALVQGCCILNCLGKTVCRWWTRKWELGWCSLFSPVLSSHYQEVAFLRVVLICLPPPPWWFVWGMLPAMHCGSPLCVFLETLPSVVSRRPWGQGSKPKAPTFESFPARPLSCHSGPLLEFHPRSAFLRKIPLKNDLKLLIEMILGNFLRSSADFGS